jgi:prepilin-type processing-associated H-X9-DG protein
LPYLEQESLYKKIDLTKPWDDPVNAEAFATSIPHYSCPEGHGPTGHTTYLAIVTPDSCMRPTDPRPLSEIANPGSTLMLIEANPEHAVHWMSPVDADEALVLGQNSDTKLPHAGGMMAAFADGRAQMLSSTASTDLRRRLISVSKDDKTSLESY